MSLSPLPIRLFCDLAARNNVIDLNTSQGAMFYRGDDIEIDIGIGQSGALLTQPGQHRLGHMPAFPKRDRSPARP